jgi:hypothetical protein
MSIPKSGIIQATFLLIVSFVINIYSQNTNISSEPLWLLILPGTITIPGDKGLENKITDIVGEVALESGRFIVFERFGVKDLLFKYNPRIYGTLPDSVALKIGQEIECDEILIVDLLSFSQIGVPPEDNEEEEDQSFLVSFFEGLFSGDSEDYSDNINTRLTVQFRNFDVISGDEIDRFPITVSHTGGTKPESEESALDNFRDVVFNEVRLIYQLISEVVAVDGVDLDLRLGSDLGITGNTLFEIVQPGEVKMVKNEEIITPGRRVGLACVQSVTDSSNKSYLLRQWDVIEAGFFANEFYEHIHGVQLFYLPKFPGDYTYIGIQYHYSPLSAWDFGGGAHYSLVSDSYNETNHGFGLRAFGARRFFTFPGLLVYAKLGLNLDIPFKQDNDGQTVTTGVFSGSLALTLSLMLSKSSDIELNFGYRLSTKSSEWTFTDEDTEIEAYWDEEPPVIDISGFYFTVGYKFIIF